MLITASVQLPIKQQYGIANFITFDSIVKALKDSGRMTREADVIGIVVTDKGLEFIYKDWA